MAPEKTYFIMRTMRYEPDDLIQLGQIITDKSKPYERLSPPQPFSGSLKPRKSTLEKWSASHTDKTKDSVRVFAKFVDLLRSEVSVARSVDETFTWEAATLETQFLPLNEDRSETLANGDKTTYLERAAKDPDVETWIKKWYHQLRSVYMVTGVMSAKQPGEATFEGAADSQLSVGARGEAPVQGGAPVNMGAEASRDVATGTHLTGQQKNNFVFAYELRRLVVFFEKLKRGDVVEGGDLHGVTPQGGDDDYDDDSEEDVDPSEMVITNVTYDDGERTGEDLEGFEEVKLDDGALIALIPNV